MSSDHGMQALCRFDGFDPFDKLSAGKLGAAEARCLGCDSREWIFHGSAAAPGRDGSNGRVMAPALL